MTRLLPVVIPCAVAALVASLSLTGCDGAREDTRETAQDPAALVTSSIADPTLHPVDRGRYLSQALLQCFVCHSERDWDLPGAPPVEGKEGAGFVWRDDGAFRLVEPNLTPDGETGIGRRGLPPVACANTKILSRKRRSVLVNRRRSNRGLA